MQYLSMCMYVCYVCTYMWTRTAHLYDRFATFSFLSFYTPLSFQNIRIGTVLCTLPNTATLATLATLLPHGKEEPAKNCHSSGPSSGRLSGRILRDGGNNWGCSNIYGGDHHPCPCRIIVVRRHHGSHGEYHHHHHQHHHHHHHNG